MPESKTIDDVSRLSGEQLNEILAAAQIHATDYFAMAKWLQAHETTVIIHHEKPIITFQHSSGFEFESADFKQGLAAIALKLGIVELRVEERIVVAKK